MVEVLAPCKDIEVLKKAIDANCDAVYLGGKKYGARAYVDNFTDEQLIEAVEYAHSFNCLVYVVVNTVIFEDEIESCLKYIDFLYLNNIDAIIIQDLGLASIVKVRYPNLKMHASTQLNCHNIEEAKFLKQIGFDRIVLARELSLAQVIEIKKNVDVEVEVFAHGALCFSYSGNCFFSSVEGLRSGNRGRCAQICRLEYNINSKNSYCFSCKDLCTIENIKEISLYVDSIKIEGRVKSKDYVYKVVSLYKKALEEDIDYKEAKYEMGILFSRGFTKGFINNETLITSDKPNHQGELIGKVIKSEKKLTTIILEHNLYKGDCLRFVGKNNDAIITNEIYKNNLLVKSAKKGEEVSLKTHKTLSKNDLCYITKRECNYENKVIYIEGIVYIDKDELILKITDGKNEVLEKTLFEESIKDQKETIKKQLLKTNDTIFRFSKLEVLDSCFIPFSNLNNLRRNALNKLYQKRIKREKRIIEDILPQYNLKYEKPKNNKKYTIYSSTYNESEDIEVIKEVTPRVNLGKNILNINNVYKNITNSYTVLLLYSLGYRKISLSIELSKSRIKLLTESLFNKLGFIPNLEIMVYGNYELMISKHCIKKFEYKCSSCSNNLIIKNKDKSYLITKDKNCNMVVVSLDTFNLLDEVSYLEKLGITNFLIDLRYVDNEIDVFKSKIKNKGLYLKEIL